jgi:hypothetical protein
VIGPTISTEGMIVAEVLVSSSVQIPIFKCQWVKHLQGVEINDYGFTIVDLTNVGHKDEPWVLAITGA